MLRIGVSFPPARQRRILFRMTTRREGTPRSSRNPRSTTFDHISLIWKRRKPALWFAPSATKPIRSCPKVPQSESPQASPSLRANLNSPTLHAQIADTRFSLTLITYLKGKVRRTPVLGPSVNNESACPTLRVDVAGAIIVHSLSAFLEGREPRRSP